MNDTDSELELRNPLVLATIAAVSLGASLIAYQHAGAVTAWVIGAPAVLAFAGILPNAARAVGFIGRVAYRDAMGTGASDTGERI